MSSISRLEIPADAVNVDGISEDLQLVIDLTKYLPSGVILSEEYDASILVTVKLKYNASEAEGEDTEKEDTEIEKPSEEASGNAEAEEDSSNNGNQGTSEKEDQKNINKTEV